MSIRAKQTEAPAMAVAVAIPLLDLAFCVIPCEWTCLKSIHRDCIWETFQRFTLLGTVSEGSARYPDKDSDQDTQMPTGRGFNKSSTRIKRFICLALESSRPTQTLRGKSLLLFVSTTLRRQYYVLISDSVTRRVCWFAFQTTYQNANELKKCNVPIYLMTFYDWGHTKQHNNMQYTYTVAVMHDSNRIFGHMSELIITIKLQSWFITSFVINLTLDR